MNGKPTAFFYLVVALVVAGLLALAGYRFYTHFRGDKPDAATGDPTRPASSSDSTARSAPAVDPQVLAKIVPAREIPTLEPAGEYKPQGDIIDIELSDWPGYAPILVANGGLEPNNDSYYARKHGFKLRIKMSEGESESWSALNSGKMAASSTTVDVLALYGSQLKVEVPVQLDFSRGGDGIITLKEITSINQLKGKTVAVAQQTEADFFLRFLAQEAGLELKPLKGLEDSRDPNRINLLFTETAEDAAALFSAFVAAGSKDLAGCVTWNPFIHDVPKEHPDKVRLLTTNRNLLIIADVLIVNQAFAKANPKIVQGMVDGIMWATQELRKNPEPYLPVCAKAFDQTVEECRESLKDVHLSNLAENLLFFSDQPGKIGTFNEIYYSAVYSYGREIIRNPVPPERLVNRKYLEELERSGAFAGQVVELGPSEERDKKTVLEGNPLLTKQIRFLFEPNSTKLDLNDPGNQRALKDLLQLLKLAPGSYLVLRGHLDNSQVAEFKRQGEAFYRRQAVRAVEMSKARAEAVKAVLVQNGVDPARIDTDGRGWDEPIPGAPPEENRRVEVQLYTLE
ncbi:MAG: OmpA family protein [Gemmatales bacterium]|nr:OmpA family protein [Gemmatales bacterium]MDW8386407.1 OmpA family protein [Gemmatales bacterium]